MTPATVNEPAIHAAFAAGGVVPRDEVAVCGTLRLRLDGAG